MLSDNSVTTWIEMLKAGDSEGAQRLWERYYVQLVDLARKHLLGLSRRVSDEGDIALSAFHSFYQAVADQRYPRLDNRDDLWQLLIMHTTRKAVDQRRYQQRLKRSQPTAADRVENAADLVDGGPDPQFAALAVEQFRLLLDLLADEELQIVAVRKLEGYANREIAELLDCSLRSVERKLALIRAIWAETNADGAPAR